MLQVIIIDDEPLIRNGLQKMMRWYDLQMEIAGTFANGALALEYVKGHPVDLAITDIKMPVMTGITFMTECLKLGRNMKFIVLSGFSDFEYVKTAARIGIENYLLKPVDIREMTQTLLQVRSKIESERKHRILLDEGIRIFRNNLLYRMITGKISSEELEERKEYIDVPLDCGDYRIVSAKFLFREPGRIPDQRPPAVSVIRQLSSWDNVFPVTDYSGRFLYLLFCGYGNDRERIETCLKGLIQYVSVTSDFRLIASAGWQVTLIEEIPESYRQSALLVNTAALDSSHEIRWADRQEVNEAFMLPHVEMEQLTQLNEACLYRNEERILEVISDIFYSNRFIPPDGLQMLASMTAAKVYANCGMRGQESFPRIAAVHSRLEDSRYFSDYPSILKWLQEMVKEIFACEAAHRASPSGIQKILQYLQDNYAEDLSLKTLADAFHLNALYLGRKIRQETGTTFTEYINRLRIGKARELLEHTDLSAKQIAQNVGYSNDKYFSIQFRKYLDMTPGEYRKKYKSHQ